MASQNPPRSSDDMILFALEQALREVWAVLKAHDPHGYLDKDQDLQKAIADKLMALADFGVTDPQELRRRTLENFDFKPPHWDAATIIVLARACEISSSQSNDARAFCLPRGLKGARRALTAGANAAILCGARNAGRQRPPDCNK